MMRLSDLPPEGIWFQAQLAARILVGYYIGQEEGRHEKAGCQGWEGAGLIAACWYKVAAHACNERKYYEKSCAL